MRSLAILLALAGVVPAAAKDVQANTPEARQALESYARCVVARKPRESARILSMDFTSTSYNTGIDLLATSSADDCVKSSFRQGKMSGDNLSFAGAIAEAMIEAGTEPVNVRLARAAPSSVKPFTASDAIAQCLARSLPDQVASLFATTPGTEAEASAATPLTGVVAACHAATAEVSGKPEIVEMTIPALRAMIATAAFRLIANSEKPDA